MKQKGYWTYDNFAHAAIPELSWQSYEYNMYFGLRNPAGEWIAIVNIDWLSLIELFWYIGRCLYLFGTKPCL